MEEVPLGVELPSCVPELEEKICSPAAYPVLPDLTQVNLKLLPFELPGVSWHDSTANALEP